MQNLPIKLYIHLKKKRKTYESYMIHTSKKPPQILKKQNEKKITHLVFVLHVAHVRSRSVARAVTGERLRARLPPSRSPPPPEGGGGGGGGARTFHSSRPWI